MKQKIFTLVLMLAMVVVAGKAFSQSNSAPAIGVPYTYNLTGVVVTGAGTAAVTYTDTHVTLPADFAVSSGTTAYSFNVTYNAGVAAGTLRVTITQGTCSNFIEMTITPLGNPTYNIAVDILAWNTGEVRCQENEATTPTVGTDAVTYGNNNSMNVNELTVQVSATDLLNVDVSGSNTFSYQYDITITNTESGLTLTLPTLGTITHTGVTALVNETYDISFVTTPGIDPQHIVATISNATITVGSQTPVNAVITTNTDNVVYSTMPAIGSLN